MKIALSSFDTRNNIYFQKQLLAKCSIPRTDGTKEECTISILDKKDEKDKHYFANARKNHLWDFGQYISIVDTYLSDASADTEGELDLKSTDFYTIENSSKECIGYCVSYYTNKEDSTDDKSSIHVEYLEKIPDLSLDRYENYDYNYKYIGQTMLSFIAKLAKKMNADNINLFMAKATPRFYLNKCYFRRAYPSMNSAYLPAVDYDKLIERNEKNCSSTIDLIY